MYQLLAGLDAFKSEILQELESSRTDIAGNLSSLGRNLSLLTGSVETVQHQLVAIGASLGHVTNNGKAAEDLPLLSVTAPTTQGYLDHAMQSKLFFLFNFFYVNIV